MLEFSPSRSHAASSLAGRPPPLSTRLLVAAFVLTFLALVLALGLAGRPDATNPIPEPDPLAEDLAKVNERWHGDWYRRREDFASDDERAKAREQWRRGYAAEVREAYRRHDREEPEWVSRTSGGR